MKTSRSDQIGNSLLWGADAEWDWLMEREAEEARRRELDEETEEVIENG